MTSSKLLINEPMRAVLPSLAVALGGKDSDRKAMILQQIHWWSYNLAGKGEGERVWVTKSVEEIRESFPWLGVRTVRRYLTDLRESGLLESKALNAYSGDSTLSYRINYDNLNKLDTSLSTPSEAGGQTGQRGCGQTGHPGGNAAGAGGPVAKLASPVRARGGGQTGQLSSYRETTDDDVLDTEVAEEEHDEHQDQGVKVDPVWFRLECRKHIGVDANITTATEVRRSEYMRIMKTYNQQQIEEALQTTSSTANRPCWSYFTKVLESDEKPQPTAPDTQHSVDEYNRKYAEAYADLPWCDNEPDQPAPKPDANKRKYTLDVEALFGSN